MSWIEPPPGLQGDELLDWLDERDARRLRDRQQSAKAKANELSGMKLDDWQAGFIKSIIDSYPADALTLKQIKKIEDIYTRYVKP